MNVASPSAQTPGVEARAGTRRILIDCSLSRFNEQPTGIPRVVLNYVTYGREFGQRNGIAVTPVELAANGRFRLRAMAGDKPGAARSAPTLRSALVVAAKIGLELLRYFTRIAIALLGLVAAVLPFRALLRAANAFSLWAPDLVSWARGKVESARGVDYIDPGVGDVLLSPNCGHEIDPAVYEAFRAQGAEIVAVVHDILPVTLPSYHVYPWRWKFERKLLRSLDYVGHYYCISNKTLLDLTGYAAQRRKTIRASVAYNGFEPFGAGRSDDAEHAALLGRRPWLMVGTLEPKKGYPEALAAFEALWAAGYRRPLAIIGRRGWMFDEIVESLEASPWWGKRLFWFGRADDAELATFYRRSHALLFASLAEGFGIPLVEAVSHGLPILARDTPTSREILGSRGVYFATTDDLMDGVKSFEDPAAYGMAREEVIGLDWFDWRSVIDSVMTDILRPPQERPTGVNLLDRSLMKPVCQAPRRPIIRVAEDDAGAIGDVLSLLAPHSVAKFRKIRVGVGGDGGYVMLDDFAGISTALSLGVGADVSWDAAIADRRIRVLQFDDSLDRAPVPHSGCAFRRAKIGPVAAADRSETTIEAILAELAPSGDLLLKMDIDGDEWGVLDTLDQASIGRFRQIVCEFHDLDRFGDPKWRLRARGAVERLYRTHCVLHVHGNNNVPQALVGSRLVPKVIEITFVRRDAYEISASTEIFPTELDRPNDPAAPDLFLGSFRFK
jgi:glycosyltransferase involved in cell wall biosynthesis